MKTIARVNRSAFVTLVAIATIVPQTMLAVEVNAEKGAAKAEIPVFGAKAKKGQWDAWSSPSSERPCANWKTFNELEVGLTEIGRLQRRKSKDIKGNSFSIDCGTLDRDMADFESYRHVMGELGVKRARFCSGWAKTEQKKGVHDFSWLDPIIAGTCEQGIEPWFVLQYGNPVYGCDFRLGMKIAQLINNPEGFAAWLKYVEAIVTRYKDRVHLWEIWNEPYGQGNDYATLALATAKVIRRIQPEAELMLSAMDPWDHDICLKRFAEAQALTWFKWWSFHPYWGYPEGTWVKQAPELREKITKANPEARLFQGEAGCPSQMEYGHALRGFNWTEIAQAKWVSRRLMCDYGEGVPTSIFSMIDNQYTYMLQSFGMVRASLLKEFIYRRPSFYALGNTASLLDDSTATMGWERSVAYTIEKPGDLNPVRTPYLGPKELSVVRFRLANGKPGFAAWYGSRFPMDFMGFDRITFAVSGVELRDPVMVEMITGRVFELGASRSRVEGGGTRFNDVPMWDSVLVFAERSDLALEGTVAPRIKLPVETCAEFETDHPDARYKCGETTTFTIRPKFKDMASITIDDWKNDHNVIKPLRVNTATADVFKISAKLDKPGFLRARIFYYKKGVGYQIAWWASAYEPEKIRPGGECPADFDAYWDGEIAKMDKNIPVDAKFKLDEARSAKGDYDYYYLSVQSTDRRIYGFVIKPKGEGPFPVSVEIPGAGYGFGGFPAPVPGKVRFIANVFDFEPGQEKGVVNAHGKKYQAMQKRWGDRFGMKAVWAAGIGSLRREDYFYHGAILGINRALTFVLQQPFCDKRDVEYRGQSQGGAFGIFLSALNGGITRATISEPALTDLLGNLRDTSATAGWPSVMDAQPTPEAKENARKNAPYYDGANFCRRIKCPVRFMAGYVDGLCPPQAVWAGYNSLPATTPKAMVDAVGCGHGVTPKMYGYWNQVLTDTPWPKASQK